MNFKKLVREQLHEGLHKREKTSRGITHAIEVLSIMKLSMDELGEIHKRAVQAERGGVEDMRLLFDYVDKDISTFVACRDHTARFQHYLTEICGDSSPLSLADANVKKVYDALQDLQDIFTTGVKNSD